MAGNNKNSRRTASNKNKTGRASASGRSESVRAGYGSGKGKSSRPTRGNTSNRRSERTPGKVININEARNRRATATSEARNRRAAVPTYSGMSSSRLSRSSRLDINNRTAAQNRSISKYSSRPEAKSNVRNIAPKLPADKTQKRSGAMEHRKVRGIGYEGAAQIFMILFLILSVLYISGNVIRYALKNAVSYDTIQIGSIDTPKSADGLIIRSETVYQASKAGAINYLVPDGEKVKAGATVATIKAGDAVAEAERSLEKMDDNIITSEQVKETIDNTNENANRLNLEIKALADSAAINFSALDTGMLRDFSNNAQVKQEMRNQAILNGADEDPAQASERQQANDVIAENSVAVTTKTGGIMCLETDGYESELTPDTMYDLTPGDIKKNSSSSHVAGSEVVEGENIFKILNSNIWYIAAYIDSDYVIDWEKGSRHTIYITDSMGQSQDVDVSVDYIEPGTKTTFVVLRSSKYIIDHMYLRNITFEIDKVKTGFKIANSSIVENTLIKIPAKYVSNGTVTKQNGVSVTVGEPTGDFAYFPVGYDTLVLGDSVVNPLDSSDFCKLSEVETRKGIYIMNTGIAQFYTIDLTDSTSNSTHTILDPEKNTNISIYDRVVVDPKNIQDNEMLYK